MPPFDQTIKFPTARPSAADPSGADPCGADPSGPRVRSDLHGVPGVSRVLPGYVAGLARDVVRLDGPMTAARRPEVRRVAHQLRGSGGSYGFPDVTRLATAVESAVDDGRPLDAVAAAVADLVALLRRLEGYDPAAERSLRSPPMAAAA